jgi:DNA repair protein RadC
MEDTYQKDSFTIHDVPESDRPRERLQRLGPESLTAQELLEVIMGKGGSHGGSVIKLAEKLLNKFTNIQGISEASVEELRSIPGIGLAKACQIKAAFELANRREVPGVSQTRTRIKTPEDAYNELKDRARGKKKEYFWAIFLDTRNQVIKSAEISIGSLDTSIVHPRELFKEAIAASASSVIAAHNHPSGNPEASQDDIRLSRRLREVGDLVGIELTDHIIIGDGKYISMKREGLI